LLEKLQGLFQLGHSAVKRGSKEINGQGPGLPGENGSHPNAVLAVLIQFNRALVLIAMIRLHRHLTPPKFLYDVHLNHFRLRKRDSPKVISVRIECCPRMDNAGWEQLGCGTQSVES
jgi:hypothetical protein